TVLPPIRGVTSQAGPPRIRHLLQTATRCEFPLGLAGKPDVHFPFGGKPVAERHGVEPIDCHNRMFGGRKPGFVPVFRFLARCRFAKPVVVSVGHLVAADPERRDGHLMNGTLFITTVFLAHEEGPAGDAYQVGGIEESRAHLPVPKTAISVRWRPRGRVLRGRCRRWKTPGASASRRSCGHSPDKC